MSKILLSGWKKILRIHEEYRKFESDYFLSIFTNKHTINTGGYISCASYFDLVESLLILSLIEFGK